MNKQGNEGLCMNRLHFLEGTMAQVMKTLDEIKLNLGPSIVRRRNQEASIDLTGKRLLGDQERSEQN